MKINITCIIICAALTGCVTQKAIIEDKSTVFGFQAVTPGPQGSSVKIQIGLVRNDFKNIPVSTNKLDTAQYSSHVDAKMSAISQSAKEDISTLPQTVNDNETTTNTAINVITQH